MRDKVNFSRLKLLSVMVIVLIVSPFVVYVVPQLVGANYSYIVTGSSMEPNIKPGDVIIVKETDLNNIEIGDIITYDRGSIRITHRVIDKRVSDGDVSFITKGDATEGPDLRPVSADSVLGEMMFKIPMMGYVILYAGTLYGFIALVIIPSVLLIAIELKKIFTNKNKKNKASIDG